MTGRLLGRSVVITRAAEQSSRLAALLAAEGADVVSVPLVAVVDPVDGGAALARALDHIDEFDWVVVTSPNATARVAAALAACPADRRPRVAAVGTASAEGLASVDLVARRQSALGLLDELPTGPGRVLLPQSAQARPVLADGLRERGWDVHVVVAYDIVPCEPTDDARRAVGHAAAVLFASGSAARAWVGAFGTVAPPLVVAIGPQTAAVAGELGLKVHLTASDHSPAGLVAALVAHLDRP